MDQQEKEALQEIKTNIDKILEHKVEVGFKNQLFTEDDAEAYNNPVGHGGASISCGNAVKEFAQMRSLPI